MINAPKSNIEESKSSTTDVVLWDSESLSEVLKQQIPTGLEITGVSIDSRSVKKGDLFVGVIGDRYNGSDFALEALNNGAVLCIVDQLPEDIEGFEKSFVVASDTLEALKQIALFARKRVVGKVVGVTGSVGKTTTKEMLQFVLSNEGKTYCSIGNFNNHFGLPLCLANMPQDTEYAVLEMGMSSAGELSELSKIAAPDVAVITTVEAVHLEFFSSVSAIAAAKSEIFTGMQTGGTAVINFENPYHPILVGAASQKKLNVMGFSETLRTEYRLLNYRVENGRAYIKAECLGKDIEYQLAILGKHHALNSLGVLAAVKAVGGDMDSAAFNLRNFDAPQGRGKIHRAKSYMVIDDSYNASPASVKAALENLALYKTSNNRVIALLGDMLELGARSAEMHIALLSDVVANQIDQVYTVGNLMQKLHEVLPPNHQGLHVNSSDELIGKIKDFLCPDDVILVKGSRSVKMDRLVQYLLQG